MCCCPRFSYFTYISKPISFKVTDYTAYRDCKIFSFFNYCSKTCVTRDYNTFISFTVNFLMVNKSSQIYAVVMIDVSLVLAFADVDFNAFKDIVNVTFISYAVVIKCIE